MEQPAEERICVLRISSSGLRQSAKISLLRSLIFILKHCTPNLNFPRQNLCQYVLCIRPILFPLCSVEGPSLIAQFAHFLGISPEIVLANELQINPLHCFNSCYYPGSLRGCRKESGGNWGVQMRRKQRLNCRPEQAESRAATQVYFSSSRRVSSSWDNGVVRDCVWEDQACMEDLNWIQIIAEDIRLVRGAPGCRTPAM